MLTGAVYQLPALWIILLVGNDERQQGDGLAGARGHLQDRVTASIEGFYSGVSRGGGLVGQGGFRGRSAYFSDHTCS